MNQFKSRILWQRSSGFMLLELSLYLVIIGLTLVVGLQLYNFIQLQAYTTQISSNVLSIENNANQYLTDNLLYYTNQLNATNVVAVDLTNLNVVPTVNNIYMGHSCLVMTLNSTQTALVPILMSQINGSSLTNMVVNSLGPSAALVILPTNSSATTLVNNSSWNYVLNISTTTLKSSCNFDQNSLVAVNLGLNPYLNLQLDNLSRFVDNTNPVGTSANKNTMFSNLYLQNDSKLLFESGTQAIGLSLNSAQNALQVESGGFITQWLQIESQQANLAACNAVNYGSLYLESSTGQFNGLVMCSYNPTLCANSGSDYCFLPQQANIVYESVVNLSINATNSGGSVVNGVFTCAGNTYLASLPDSYAYTASGASCPAATPNFSAANGGSFVIGSCTQSGAQNICKSITLQATWCICSDASLTTQASCSVNPFAVLNNLSCSATNPLYFN